MTHFLDSHEIERDKGITIFSKQAVMRFVTPIYFTWLARVTLTFLPKWSVLQACLITQSLVISGTDRIQNHTETLWRLLARYNIPTLCCEQNGINTPTETPFLMNCIQDFSDGCIDFTQNPENEDFRESLAICDESIMNTFLADGTVKNQDIRKPLYKEKCSRAISALRQNGRCIGVS